MLLHARTIKSRFFEKSAGGLATSCVQEQRVISQVWVGDISMSWNYCPAFQAFEIFSDKIFEQKNTLMNIT